MPARFSSTVLPLPSHRFYVVGPVGTPEYINVSEPAARDFSIEDALAYGCLLLRDTGYPIFHLAFPLSREF